MFYYVLFEHDGTACMLEKRQPLCYTFPKSKKNLYNINIINCVYMGLSISVINLILGQSYWGYDVYMYCTQRNLVIHIPLYMVNTSIPAPDYCILFAQALTTFKTEQFRNRRKTRPLLIVGLAPLNTNIVFSLLK